MNPLVQTLPTALLPEIAFYLVLGKLAVPFFSFFYYFLVSSKLAPNPTIVQQSLLPDLLSVFTSVLQYSPFVLAIGQYFVELPLDLFLIISTFLVSDTVYSSSLLVRVLAIVGVCSTGTVGLVGTAVMAIGGFIMLSVGNAQMTSNYMNALISWVMIEGFGFGAAWTYDSYLR